MGSSGLFSCSAFHDMGTLATQVEAQGEWSARVSKYSGKRQGIPLKRQTSRQGQDAINLGQGILFL
jgi:hypothetical protein